MMTNKQDKLTKLIEIAVENGWEEPKYIELHLFSRLFSHDFAKAIWGKAIPHDFIELKTEPGYKCKCGLWASEFSGSFCEEGYKHHLQQAVISDDPLEYYWENK